jgi:hypothetical protein
MCSVGSIVSRLPSRLDVCRHLLFIPTPQVVFVWGFQLCWSVVIFDLCGSATKIVLLPVFFSKCPAQSLLEFPNVEFCLL